MEFILRLLHIQLHYAALCGELLKICHLHTQFRRKLSMLYFEIKYAIKLG
jgi:hypothetical protein